MVKNKSVLLCIMVIGVIFISGCVDDIQTTNDIPYITKVTPDKQYGSEGDTINVIVSVKNPTKVNYDGYVLIQADLPNCFGMGNVDIGTQQHPNWVSGYISSLSVLAGTTNSALVPMQIPINNQAVCYQTADHTLKIFILQNGQVLGSKIIDFSLFENK